MGRALDSWTRVAEGPAYVQWGAASQGLCVCVCVRKAPRLGTRMAQQTVRVNTESVF